MTAISQKMLVVLVTILSHTNASVTPRREYRIQSYNFPNSNIGFSSDGHVTITTTPETFHIVSPGLLNVPGTVSFESVRYPGRYLRHEHYVLYLDTFEEGNHKLFKKDATFYPRNGKFFPGYTSYESYNFPDYFIHHQNSALKITRRANSEQYRKEASFLEIEDSSAIHKTSPNDFISSNFPQYSIGFTNNNLLSIVENDKEKFLVVSPGLNGQIGTVSLESERHPGHYLRQRNFMIHLDEFEENNVFFNDASFFMRRGIMLQGYASFVSYSYPNRYIRHQHDRLNLQTFDGTTQFRSDASFLPSVGPANFEREGPFRFVSKNYGDHTISLDDSGIPKVLVSGGDLFYIVRPGLTGEEGTVSLASAAYPGHYLRYHRDYLIHLDPYEESNDYKPTATFRLHQNRFYQGYLALESSTLKDYYIRHEHWYLKISRNDNSELFRLDSSFMLK